MILIRYLLEYTLETVCHGNRSECARRMGMAYTEFRKIRKRLSEGGGSSRATEALLEMYWREGLSVDEVFKRYTQTNLGSDIEEAERMCGELVAAVRQTIQAKESGSRRSASLMKAAYEFVEQIQKCFCEDLCRRTRYKDDPCPAMRLVELMNWLKVEMDDLSGS